ncbi:hypothetical protein DM02DRAFT_82452 [Periconia macrospinosa]|uniref:Uncharacterized protein n=1 Tax=Periconia macrospinosa TaxID=97972 RepID=A0A2V1DJM9_9PLEO|nr:hypothetical protein DM02DRAFT_82452 [Periconia macrospinosa]
MRMVVVVVYGLIALIDEREGVQGLMGMTTVPTWLLLAYKRTLSKRQPYRNNNKKKHLIKILRSVTQSLTPSILSNILLHSDIHMTHTHPHNSCIHSTHVPLISKFLPQTIAFQVHHTALYIHPHSPPPPQSNHPPPRALIFRIIKINHISVYVAVNCLSRHITIHFGR